MDRLLSLCQVSLDLLLNAYKQQLIVIREDGYQKCLCPCLKLDNRKKGYCKDYTSDCYIFEDELRLALFPKSKKSNIIKNMFVPDTIDNIKSKYENVCKNLMKNT